MVLHCRMFHIHRHALVKVPEMSCVFLPSVLFQVPVAKFQELRYNVALILKEMNDLEKRSILKIQDWALLNWEFMEEIWNPQHVLWMQNRGPSPLCLYELQCGIYDVCCKYFFSIQVLKAQALFLRIREKKHLSMKKYNAVWEHLCMIHQNFILITLLIDIRVTYFWLWFITLIFFLKYATGSPINVYVS